jgi:hypothetical protein
MIIPTPAYDPLFADDGIPFRTKMLQYILREFADLPETQVFLRMIEAERKVQSAPLIFQLRSALLRDSA